MTDDRKPIIQLEKVSKAFGPQLVLDRVDLSIEPGCTTVIIGPSGSGKSVLLKHMVGLLRPDSGKVYFDQQDITALPERKLGKIRSRISYVFQGAALFDSMSVQDNILFPLEEHALGTRSERSERCHEVLALVGLADVETKYPEELSGGQKKRVALARALVLNPDVILYDEPTTGLDPIRADLINELILRLQRKLQRTAVVVTHDMTSTRKIADRVVMLSDAHLIADVTPDQLDATDNDLLARFVKGQASREELQAIEDSHRRMLASGSRET